MKIFKNIISLTIIIIIIVIIIKVLMSANDPHMKTIIPILKLVDWDPYLFLPISNGVI